VLFAVAATVATLLGGVAALRFRARLYLILSVTAGVLLGVVSFDLLPEIFSLAREHGLDPARGMIALVGGFLLFHAFEKLLLVHHSHETNYAVHRHPQVGMLSALALAGHSFLDGVGIGLGFQVSPSVGLVVAVAVLAHDVSDGANTVSLMLMHHNSPFRSAAMLLLDALAPIAGVAATLLVRVSPGVLMLYLGFFAGFLLYIAAADILPEAHSQAPSRTVIGLIGLTCLGAAFVLMIVRVTA
jgi:ZIP family zinc transporter